MRDHKHKSDSADLGIDALRTMFDAYLATKGLRNTSQRRVVTDTFFRAHGRHLSVEELWGLVRKRDPRVGFATVYRTLKLLEESGLANERNFGERRSRYEIAHADTHHDHLICTSCNRIVEFEDEQIERLQEKVAKRYGFSVSSHKHELYGLCSDCRASRS